MYHPPKVRYLGGEGVPTTAVSTQMFTFCFFALWCQYVKCFSLLVDWL